MLNFINFITLNEAKLTAVAGDSFKLGDKSSEQTRGDYDANKYIHPFLPGNELHSKATHVLKTKHEGLNPGDRLTIHGHSIINGVHHAVVTSESNPRRKVVVPLSKINKPENLAKSENEGHKYEKSVFDRLKRRGIVPEGVAPAGSTAGSDVKVIDKRKNKIRTGRVISSDKVHPDQSEPEGRLLSGEVKGGTNAAFGQLTVRHDPAKGGWHIPDKARALRPRYAKAIEDSGLIERLNRERPDPHAAEKTASGRVKNITQDHPDLGPAEEYLHDHHVDFLQVGDGHGSYSVGEKDKTGHGLPRIKDSGEGRWTARQKERSPSALTIMFQPKGKRSLKNSHVNLDKDDHLENFARTLGH